MPNLADSVALCIHCDRICAKSEMSTCDDCGKWVCDKDAAVQEHGGFVASTLRCPGCADKLGLVEAG